MWNQMNERKEHRTQILQWLQAGINAVHPRKCIPQALQYKDGKLIVQGREFGLTQDPTVIAIGKASLEMMRETLKVIPSIDHGIVVTPAPYKDVLRDQRIEVIAAEHPVPDKGSMEAGKRIKGFLSNRNLDDVIICLLSGGGSSLLAYPVETISLQDKVMMTKLLLSSGATIHEINAIRKHISQVKGGKLVELSRPASIITLAISDVIGDNPQVIASGPTYFDSSTYKDAMRIIEKYSLKEKTPESILKYIMKGKEEKYPETPKSENKIFEKAHFFIIASNDTACNAIAEEIRKQGINTEILTTEMKGEAKEVGKYIAELTKDRLKRNVSEVLIIGGETTVSLSDNPGQGGRNQEVVCSFLSAMRDLKDGWTFASMGSDGIDQIIFI